MRGTTSNPSPFTLASQSLLARLYKLLEQGRRKESRARGGRQEQKGTYYLRPTNLSQKWRASEALFGEYRNIMGYASHSHINDCLFQSNIAAFSLYDLCCIILTIRKQIIAFKKGTFAPLLLQLKGRGSLLPPAPLSGVPVLESIICPYERYTI